MTKAQELRDQSQEELEVTHAELCKKLFQLRNEHRLNRKLEKPHEVSATRRDIARVLTVLNQKKRSEKGA